MEKLTRAEIQRQYDKQLAILNNNNAQPFEKADAQRKLITLIYVLDIFNAGFVRTKSHTNDFWGRLEGKQFDSFPSLVRDLHYASAKKAVNFEKNLTDSFIASLFDHLPPDAKKKALDSYHGKDPFQKVNISDPNLYAGINQAIYQGIREIFGEQYKTKAKNKEGKEEEVYKYKALDTARFIVEEDSNNIDEVIKIALTNVLDPKQRYELSKLIQDIGMSQAATVLAGCFETPKEGFWGKFGREEYGAGRVSDLSRQYYNAKCSALFKTKMGLADNRPKDAAWEELQEYMFVNGINNAQRARIKDVIEQITKGYAFSFVKVNRGSMHRLDPDKLHAIMPLEQGGESVWKKWKNEEQAGTTADKLKAQLAGTGDSCDYIKNLKDTKKTQEKKDKDETKSPASVQYNGIPFSGLKELFDLVGSRIMRYMFTKSDVGDKRLYATGKRNLDEDEKFKKKLHPKKDEDQTLTPPIVGAETVAEAETESEENKEPEKLILTPDDKEFYEARRELGIPPSYNNKDDCEMGI